MLDSLEQLGRLSRHRDPEPARLQPKAVHLGGVRLIVEEHRKGLAALALIAR